MGLMFERSKETSLVVAVLRGANREISYEGMTNQTGLTIKQVKRVLPAARKILKDENILFDAVWGVGLVRLTDAEKVAHGAKRKRRIYNQSKYGLSDLATIQDFGRLPSSDQLIASTDRTIFSLTMQQTRPPRKPKDKVAPAPVADINAMFGKK